MIQFMKFIVYLRKKVNAGKIPYLTIFSLVTISAFVIAILTDVYIPWNYWTNSIRAIISGVLGVLTFSLVYSIAVYFKQTKVDDKEQFKRKYSVNQRINISIILIVCSAFLHLILIEAGEPLYTSIFGLMVAFWISLVLFVRPYREEYKKAGYGMEDERDY